MSFRRPRRVAWAEDGEVTGPRVFLMPLPAGEPLILDGSAALIWTAAASGAADVSVLLAQSLEVVPDSLRPDVEAFLGRLVADGLLEEAGSDPDEST